MKEDIKEENVQEEVKEEVVSEEVTPQEEAKKEESKEKKGFFKKKEDQEKIKLQEENAVLKDKVLRTTAEMQNMRRRMEEEKSLALKFEGEDLIKKLLPIIDNFERAVADDSKLSDEMKKFLEGFKMIYGNLNSILESYQVKAMDVLNKEFDPNTMEAVLAEEVEGVLPNVVIDVLQKGYTYKDKVIRHAMVKVSK
ncbi:MAG: nucleotide exchange factor GrpE [Bacilli bacterium]|nr:nucleotide exchange factor GrpE [Bacilli bacterium]